MEVKQTKQARICSPLSLFPVSLEAVALVETGQWYYRAELKALSPQDAFKFGGISSGGLLPTFVTVVNNNMLHAWELLEYILNILSTCGKLQDSIGMYVLLVYYKCRLCVYARALFLP